MLFVCLFDLISSGSRKNNNLWKSLRGIMVNGAPREVPRVLNGVPREYIEGTPRPDPRPKTIGSGLKGPSIYSLGQGEIIVMISVSRC